MLWPARASFPAINDAVEAVINILQAGIPIARIELVDELSMKQVNHYSETSLTGRRCLRFF